MNNNDTTELFSSIQELLDVISRLEDTYGRKFSLDGHLFGSIGEIFAKSHYGITLYDNQSNKMIDGEINNKTVQIKITQTNGVDVRATKNDNGERVYPDFLLVLFLNKKERTIYEVYNGSAEMVLRDKSETKSNVYHISLNKLVEFRNLISTDESIPSLVHVEKWEKGMNNQQL